MAMTVRDNDLLTTEEVAKLLGVAVSTLIRWRRETRKEKKQTGPYWVQISHNVVKYRRGAVDDYIVSREQREDG